MLHISVCLLVLLGSSLRLQRPRLFFFLHACHSCGHCGDVSLLRMDSPAQKRSYYIYILLYRYCPCQLCTG